MLDTGGQISVTSSSGSSSCIAVAVVTGNQ